MSVVNYLDVSFNLTYGSFKPFRKPDDNPVYINVKSNHPPNIIKEVPNSINKRLSSLADCEDTFNDAIPMYRQALSNSGFSHDLKFDHGNNTKKPEKRQRSRKVIWFNPPFSRNVTTNIGKAFFKLLDRHFPKGSQLSKIFNKHTVKLSYSCTDNVQAIISAHNKRILNPPADETNELRQCSCPRNAKVNCPLDGKCLAKNIVYKASVTPASSTTMHYIGLTSTTFKERLGNHTQSFKREHLSQATELSKYIWKLKRRAIPYNIKWTIVQHANPYNPASKRCNLCIAEKFHIMSAPKLSTLNTRSELSSNCRHKRKWKLIHF
jgi:hypothetical protein